MDYFLEALYGEKGTVIPKNDDWFAPLIGEWDFDYKDCYLNDDINFPQRILKGEWIFRRVLNGRGIEDMFICPSRETMKTNPQPDGEYGVGLRMYNSEKHCYDMVYACENKFVNICFKMEDGILTGTVLDNPSNKWRFLERNKDSFLWQNITVSETRTIKINCEVYAKRKNIK